MDILLDDLVVINNIFLVLSLFIVKHLGGSHMLLSSTNWA
jgi:hypothetical protein